MARPIFSVYLFALALCATVAVSQEPATDPSVFEEAGYGEEVVVTERASALVGHVDSATEGATGAEDLARRPLLRPGDLVEAVPGVIATQHSGGGKANQYFLRGFNLDHGTDFRVTVGGVPINLSTHGHGQGYTDLNFLIPELVERVEYRKGPYFAEEGDFSAAGAAHFELMNELPGSFVKLDAGEDDYQRLVAASSLRLGGGTLVGGLEAARNDGPWVVDEDLQKANALLRFSKAEGARGFSLTALGYDNEWTATDQIPRRAVESGRISRFGSLDATNGGTSSRASLALEAWRAGARSLSRLNAYAVTSDLDLFSNFTYFLGDPENGDQFGQKDRRTYLGASGQERRETTVLGRTTELRWGFDLRADWIDNGLFATRERVRLGTVRQDEIQLVMPAIYGEARFALAPKVRSIVGLRADGYWADVQSDRAANSDRASDTIVSPKLSFVFGPWSATEVYLNLGSGFHSNDARGTTIRLDPVTGEPATRVPALVRARGVDLGVRTERFSNLILAASLFDLTLASELVFVGDAGATEAGRPSRRSGVELTAFYRPRPWLTFDLDAAYTRARFRDDDPAGDRIPGAMERVLAAGVALEDRGPIYGSLRVRYFGERPLIEDDSARSEASTIWNARLGYRFANGLDLALEGFNLTDEEASDIDYFFASRLPGEPVEGVEDIHFHPAEPRRVRLVLAWRFGAPRLGGSP